MRIVTWNMDQRGHGGEHDAAWRWLLDGLRPDLALLQECVPPRWARDRCAISFEPAYPGERDWGTAIAATGLELRPVSLAEVGAWLARLGPDAAAICPAARLTGWCVSAELDLPGVGTTRVASLHSPVFPIDRRLLAGVDLRDLRASGPAADLWLVDVLFHFARAWLDRPLLIGGDFNRCRANAARGGESTEFFERIAGAGFVSLHRLFHEQDEPSFFHSRAAPRQVDHLYCDRTVAAGATRCDVVARAEAERFSDHSPLVLELGSRPQLSAG